MGQVEEYLSQPRLRCLVCGAFFRVLGPHLKSHSMTADQYRMRFGIPFMCPLACPDAVGHRSRVERERALDNPAYVERRAQHLALALAAKAARPPINRPCPTKPDACARLDDAPLLSMTKAERMQHLRERLADGAAERAQARMERQQHERDYRQAYNARKAQREAA